MSIINIDICMYVCVDLCMRVLGRIDSPYDVNTDLVNRVYRLVSNCCTLGGSIPVLQQSATELIYILYLPRLVYKVLCLSVPSYLRQFRVYGNDTGVTKNSPGHGDITNELICGRLTYILRNSEQ